MGIEQLTPLEIELANRIKDSWNDINAQISNIFSVIDYVSKKQGVSQEDLITNLSFPLNSAIKQCEIESEKLLPTKENYNLYKNSLINLMQKLLELRKVIGLFTVNDSESLKEQKENLKDAIGNVTESVRGITTPEEAVLAA